MSFVTNEVEYLLLDINNLDELVKLLKLYDNVFEMEPFEYPSHSYLKKLLKSENIIFVVAEYEDKIIGGLTAHQLASIYYEANDVYVIDLAVHQDFQRMGIGSKLIEELKEISCGNGDKEIFLQADFVDKYALDFYNKIGGIPEDVIHFSFVCGKEK